MAVLAILLGIVARDAANAAFGAMPAPSKRLFAHPSSCRCCFGLQALMSAPLVDYTEHRVAPRASPSWKRSRRWSALRRARSFPTTWCCCPAGVPVQWEPAIFAELASTGTWDEAPFVDAVKAGQFAFFITAGARGERLFDSRYNPAVADAMDAAYPVKRKIAGYTLHLPPAPRAKDQTQPKRSRNAYGA